MQNPTPNAHTEPELAHDPTIEGHHYDGIREYDNPMPGWWLWIFWLCIAFAPVYMLGIHVFGYVDTYEEDLAQGQAELAAIRAAYAEANPAIEADAATLATLISDPAAAAAGATLYEAYCQACHGDQGQGLIGPNLTDAYWIHGAEDTDLFAVITDGVVAKGMAPWGSVLSPEQRAQVIAFIRTQEGTNPPGAKAPEGTLVPSS